MSLADRRSAAIMFTDMVSYTALTQTNESLALEMLSKQGELLRPIFLKHLGKEVKTIGDAFLVEFDSALNATLCAIDIQTALHEYNSSPIPEDQRIKLRIGIHFGEIIHQHNDVFGNAVNIASRVEPLAEPGGVCLSHQVYTQVKEKINNRFEKLAPLVLKGVQFPIDVYRIVLPWTGILQDIQTEPKIRVAKRLAVLPFANMSQDPHDEYFADGITEELISTLSKIGGVSVISRTTVLQYKSSPKPIREIGMELEVGTILEGSVRKSGDLIRISVQAIDAWEDKHIWSASYDRNFKDIFAIQSDIAQNVADVLRVKLLGSTKKNIERGATRSMAAYNNLLKGIYDLSLGTQKDNFRAIEDFESALHEDPTFAPAYSWLANIYTYQAGDMLSPADAFPKALSYVTKALELDRDLAEAHNSRAILAFQYDWNWELAEREFKLSIELNPSFSLAYTWYAWFLAFLGRAEEAIPIAIRGQELDPLAVLNGSVVAHVYILARRFDEGIQEMIRLIELYPKNAGLHTALAFCFTQAGRFEDAVKELETARKMALAAGIEEADYLQYSNSSWEYTSVSLAYAALGRKEEVRKILEHLEKASISRYVGTTDLALVRLALEDKEYALELFAESYEEHSPGLIFLSQYPMLEEIHSEPRFTALLEKCRLI
ncbi:MAG: hypothetical protein OK439_02340 [Thaumarchaeota archaeon]|nr:hypothetical protein [Nitrososphaerota archaeon]